jgi:hypothetical protein
MNNYRGLCAERGTVLCGKIRNPEFVCLLWSDIDYDDRRVPTNLIPIADVKNQIIPNFDHILAVGLVVEDHCPIYHGRFDLFVSGHNLNFRHSYNSKGCFVRLSRPAIKNHYFRIVEGFPRAGD